MTKKSCHGDIGAPEAETEMQFCIVAGDSHCLAYDGVEAEFSGSKVHFRSAFCSSPEGARASNLAMHGPDADVFVNPKLLDAIRTAEEAFIEEHPTVEVSKPNVFLTIGGIDTILEMQQPDWQAYDILVPDFPDLVDTERFCHPYAPFVGRLERDFENLRVGLKLLQAEYECILRVMSPPPPHKSTEQLIEHCNARGIASSIPEANTRWKLTWMINRKVRQCCVVAGVPYIDTWPVTSSGGFLAPGYEMDGFHGNKDYAARSALLAVEAMTGLAKATDGPAA